MQNFGTNLFICIIQFFLWDLYLFTMKENKSRENIKGVALGIFVKNSDKFS